jgi:anti-sigma B factor antagonist
VISPQLIVTTRRATADVAVLTIGGELDRDTVGMVRDEMTSLERDGVHRLVCDLSGLTFCDSSGMGAFIDAHRGAAAHGGWLRLAALRPEIRSLFAVLALDRLLEFRDSVETALPPSV